MREVKGVKGVKEVKEVKAICLMAKSLLKTHAKGLLALTSSDQRER